MRRIVIPAMMLATGCTVGPNYKAPEIAVPPAYTDAGTPANAQDLAQWWKGFGDPELDRLIEIATSDSLDLKTAASRVRQARFGEIAARSALFPQINGTADANHINLSKNAGLSSLQSLFGGGGGSAPSGIGTPGTGITTYSVGFDASWELDIFGGTRRAIEGARARTEAATWDERGARLSLVAEVANSYLQLRTLQQREVIAREEVGRQQRMLSLADHSAQVGLVAEDDAIRQRAQLAATQALIGPLVAEQRVQMHAIGVLLGRAPEPLIGELSVVRPLPAVPPTVPPGLPSELLRRRPDIRAAERQLAAATADIGVAVADLYPRFTLTGMGELISTTLVNLFTGNSLQWSANAQAVFPVLDFGRRHAQAGIRREQASQAYLAYQQTVLTALKDVEDALVRVSAEQRRNAALRQGVADGERSVAAVTARYRTGLVDLSAVLDAQASLNTSRDALASSDGMLRSDLASLYKALGGGWDEAVRTS
jgi:NodT family efflux transporter outer membrane factor (OMF) lipoprotein